MSTKPCRNRHKPTAKAVRLSVSSYVDKPLEIEQTGGILVKLGIAPSYEPDCPQHVLRLSKGSPRPAGASDRDKSRRLKFAGTLTDMYGIVLHITLWSLCCQYEM